MTDHRTRESYAQGAKGFVAKCSCGWSVRCDDVHDAAAASAEHSTTADGLVITARRTAVPQPVDITIGVRVLFDCVVQSMDWGSGFLSDEEARQILDVGDACGFVSDTDYLGEYKGLLAEVRAKRGTP